MRRCPVLPCGSSLAVAQSEVPERLSLRRRAAAAGGHNPRRQDIDPGSAAEVERAARRDGGRVPNRRSPRAVRDQAATPPVPEPAGERGADHASRATVRDRSTGERDGALCRRDLVVLRQALRPRGAQRKGRGGGLRAAFRPNPRYEVRLQHGTLGQPAGCLLHVPGDREGEAAEAEPVQLPGRERGHAPQEPLADHQAGKGRARARVRLPQFHGRLPWLSASDPTPSWRPLCRSEANSEA